MNELKRLKSQHLKIVELSLLGLTPGRIAKEMGMTRENITLVTSSPMFQEELARRRAEQTQLVDQKAVKTALELLNENSLRAAEKQVDLLDSMDEKVAQKSAMDILDRTGFAKVSETRTKSLGVQVSLTMDELKRIQMNTRRVFNQEDKSEILTHGHELIVDDEVVDGSPS